MIRYILKRLLWMIPIIIAVTILIFTLMYFVPGDFTSIVLGSNATQAQIEEFREAQGLNDPYFVQLGRYLKRLIIDHDFGNSYIYSTSVMDDLLERFPRTAILAIGTMLVGVIFGVPLGIAAALNRNTWVDKLAMLVSMIGTAMPSFWAGLLLVLLFSLKLGWLPSQGMGGPQYYILPCLGMGIAGISGQCRQMRSSLLEVVRADYVTTARSKGISEAKVLFKHELPNALIPTINALGGTFGMMLGATLVIENVFSIPGIGAYMVSAIGNRDYPAVEGSVIFLAVIFALGMLIVDLAYAFVDPRIKAQYEAYGGKKKKKKTVEEENKDKE